MSKTPEKIIEKAHCPRCGTDVCAQTGLYFQLASLDGDNSLSYLSKTLGDFTVPLGQYDTIEPGTPLYVKCGRCQTPVNRKHHPIMCFLNKVKLVGDPYEDYEVKFLSEMGKHGTVLIKEGVIIDQWGEHVDELIAALQVA